jgi:uncharacterized membrane protein
MTFDYAMHEVLETSRYDFLTGRRVDIREVIFELIDSVLTWIFENIGFNMPTGVIGDAGLIVTVFSAVAIIVIAVASFVLIRAYLRSRVRKRHTIADIFEEIRNHTVAELLELSRDAENRRVAIRYKYIAAILHLNENDIIVIEPSATNAIISRQIRAAAPHLHDPFSRVAHAFHLTWFGHKHFSDENFSAFDLALGDILK